MKCWLGNRALSFIFIHFRERVEKRPATKFKTRSTTSVPVAIRNGNESSGFAKLPNVFGMKLLYVINEATGNFSHRPNTAAPRKPTTAIMQNANPPAALA